MGMDLKPVRPTKDAPRDDNGNPIWGHYNWSGWRHLANSLHEWGHPDLTEHLSGWNDGDRIPSKVCKQVGKLIEEHLNEVEDVEWREYEKMKALLWKTCGGYRQF